MASPMERGLASLFHSILVKHQTRQCLQAQLKKISSLVSSQLPAADSEKLCSVRLQSRQLHRRDASLSSTISADNIVQSPFPPTVIPNETIPEFIWKDIKTVEDVPFIVDAENGRGYSYGGARSVSRKFAAALVKSGLKPGDVLTIILPNIPEYPLVMLGALEAGVIVSSANPLYTEHEISHQLSNSGSRCVVTLPSLLPVVRKAFAKLKTEMPIITLSYDEEKAAGTWDFHDMISANVDTSLIPVGCRKSEDIALIPYSSGTTGLSKGVALTHRNIVSNVEMQRTPGLLKHQMPTSEYQDVTTAVLPFYHSYGMSALLLGSMANRAKVISFPKFDPVTYLKTLKTQKPRSVWCCCAPPLTLFMGVHPAVTPDYLESVKVIYNGAGPIGLSDIEKLVAKRPEKNGFKFYNAYGLTETSPTCTLPKETSTSKETVGSPLANTQIRVVDESGKNLGPNENGELYIRGPHVMKGYYKNEEATREALDENGWFRTGDMGYYSEEGEFFIVERLKELIKVKGFQVPPAELEALLRSHPDISEAGVIGAPDERTGEKPVAFVVAKPGKNPNLDEVKEFVSKHVAAYKQISEINQVDAIPKTLTGKILRRTIKEEYLKHNS